MELWVPLTIAAAVLQGTRLALQKVLQSNLSDAGATYARFVFAVPLAALYVVALERGLPSWEGVTAEFLGYGAVGGVAQILGTVLLVRLFARRNFAVGTTLAKTETIQTAFLGALVLQEWPSRSAFVAIAVSLVGVILISGAGIRWRDALRRTRSGAVLLGLGAGACFAVSAVSYRSASLALLEGGAFHRAALTLLGVTTLQTVLMSVYLRLREPGQITAVLASWRTTGAVGLTGMLGSVGWFTAMTLQNAAYVRALGQVEILFTLAVSRFAFGETTKPAELAGMALIVGGILVLLGPQL